MARVACAEEGSLLPKEEDHWRVLGVVSLAVVRCGLPKAGGTPCSGAIVEVVADDDGIVPGCPGGGAP